MEKLEKVIAGLECCAGDASSQCEGSCPYFKGFYVDDCFPELVDDALRILKMWDVIHKDIWDRTHEIVRLKKELKTVRVERDAALEKLSWLEEKPTPNDWGKYPPDFPREGM